VEGEPQPLAPALPIGRDGKVLSLGLVGIGPGGEDLTAVKAQVVGYASRMENPDLVVPAGQRARYEAAFARFSSVFPDAFYLDAGDENRKMCSLYLGIMDRMGIQLDRFGDADTRLANL